MKGPIREFAARALRIMATRSVVGAAFVLLLRCDALRSPTRLCATRLPQEERSYFILDANTGHGETLPPEPSYSNIQADLGATLTKKEWLMFLDRLELAHAAVGVPAVEGVENVPKRETKATCAARAASATERLAAFAASSASRAALVELGSREGNLAARLEPLAFESLTLVDREHPDGSAANHPDARRIAVDLRDFDLPGVADATATVVGKHVCGAACDNAIRAAARARPEVFAIAPCCYFACDYETYPNRDFLAEIGFSGARDFGRLIKLTQWGPDEYAGLGVPPLAGQQAMDLLDEGRVRYLCERGVDASVAHYATPAIEPGGALERSLLVGWRAPSQ